MLLFYHQGKKMVGLIKEVVAPLSNIIKVEVKLILRTQVIYKWYGQKQ